jgi:hypothetical protein
MKIIIGGKEQVRSYYHRDQFGAEISYFSDCILKSAIPKPLGNRGPVGAAPKLRPLRIQYPGAMYHAWPAEAFFSSEGG